MRGAHGADWVTVSDEEHRKDVSRIATTRLLGIRADGQGRDFQFQGYARHRYTTFALVWALEDERVLLCLPEWHPGRPVALSSRLLPEAGIGSWIKLRCDLSASSAARLQPSDLRRIDQPGVQLHRATIAPRSGAA